jgi:pyruvate/2-oxoglutarate dehydrogenase complex dihydrolipoamide dehydrogenase (E3) component
MSDFETYDALVVGCGESGKYMGWHLAGKRKRVLVIAERYLGG